MKLISLVRAVIMISDTLRVWHINCNSPLGAVFQGTLPTDFIFGVGCIYLLQNIIEPRHDKTKTMSVRISPIWSESSLSAWRKLGSLATHWAHSEDCDQIGRMPRLIWVFAGRTCHFVGFVMRRLHCFCPFCDKTKSIFQDSKTRLKMHVSV